MEPANANKQPALTTTQIPTQTPQKHKKTRLYLAKPVWQNRNVTNVGQEVLLECVRTWEVSGEAREREQWRVLKQEKLTLESASIHGGRSV